MQKPEVAAFARRRTWFAMCPPHVATTQETGRFLLTCYDSFLLIQNIDHMSTRISPSVWEY